MKIKTPWKGVILSILIIIINFFAISSLLIGFKLGFWLNYMAFGLSVYFLSIKFYQNKENGGN